MKDSIDFKNHPMVRSFQAPLRGGDTHTGRQRWTIFVSALGGLVALSFFTHPKSVFAQGCNPRIGDCVMTPEQMEQLKPVVQPGASDCTESRLPKNIASTANWAGEFIKTGYGAPKSKVRCPIKKGSVFEDVARNVFKVIKPDNRVATAFLIEPSDPEKPVDYVLALTNAHATYARSAGKCENLDTVQLDIPGNRETTTARVYKRGHDCSGVSFMNNDWAVLVINKNDAPRLPPGIPVVAATADTVVSKAESRNAEFEAIGYNNTADRIDQSCWDLDGDGTPEGKGSAFYLPPKPAFRFDGETDFWGTNVPVGPGYSGSPFLMVWQEKGTTKIKAYGIIQGGRVDDESTPVDAKNFNSVTGVTGKFLDSILEAERMNSYDELFGESPDPALASEEKGKGGTAATPNPGRESDRRSSKSKGKTRNAT